jgi:hypothetical protein
LGFGLILVAFCSGGQTAVKPNERTTMNDADIEYANLVAAGTREARLRKQGICCHGWTQSYNPIWAIHLKPGEVQCKECGKVFASEADCYAERCENLI